ncbi:MAG: MFS transporter [Actinobacteria bacterium]|nr:MFS transporter [Actinomycetota bacterium]
MIKGNIFRSYVNLPRNVYILFIADIINSAGSFVYPFLTFFLTLKLGFDAKTAGLVLTIVIFAEGVGRLIGGKLADWIGRKFVIILLSLLGSACFLIIAFLGISPIIPYLVILAGFLKSGALPAINALIIDATGRVNRNDAFSLLYLGNNIGFAIGPLVAGFLFTNHIELIFFIDAFTTIIALIPIAIYVKETLHTKISFSSLNGNSMNNIPPDNQNIEDEERAETGNTLRIFFRKPILVGYAFISIIFSFVYAQSTFSLPLYLDEIFSSNEGPRIFGSLMTVNAVVVILLTLILITIFKKFNPLINISIAGLLFAVGFGILFYSKIYIFFIISTIIWTFGEIIDSVSSNVLVANYSPVTHRGRFNAIISFISGVGFGIGPLLMGIYMRYYGVKNSWIFIFSLSVFASISMLFLFVFERLRSKKQGL